MGHRYHHRTSEPENAGGSGSHARLEATPPNRDKALPATLLCTVTDLDGHTILTQKETVTLEANRTSKIKLQFPFENAKLWSPETPNLYRMVCCLVPANGEPADTVTTTFGVRHVEYNAEKGLVLNGKAIEMNAASYRDAEWRKARLMKEAGFNAVRTSHNPPSEAFLDACDHLGLLVIDESFDGWRSAKTPKDYSVLFDQWWTKDIESMVLRDRNRPYGIRLGRPCTQSRPEPSGDICPCGMGQRLGNLRPVGCRT